MDMGSFVTFSLILVMGFGLFLLRKTYACSTYLVETVADDSLTTSSVYQDDSRVAASQARLNQPFGWSPHHLEDHPWIQVSFGRRVRIKKVLTQGLGDIIYQEWVTKYKVLYRDETSSWATVQYGTDNEFPANYDYSTTVKNTLPSTISATYLRLYPTQCNNFCSLRFDVIGCDEVTTTTLQTTTTVLTSQIPEETTSLSTVTIPVTEGLITKELDTDTTTTTTAKDQTTHVVSTEQGNTRVVSSEQSNTRVVSKEQSNTRVVSTEQSNTHVSSEQSNILVVSTEQSNIHEVSSGSLCLCTCTEEDNSTLTKPELEVRISDIIENLEVPKNTTSSFIRKKISVYDRRPDAVYVGSLGIAVICFIAILIVVPDIVSVFCYITTRNEKELSRSFLNNE